MVVVLLVGLVVSCRWMLSVEDRAAIMVGLEAGLSQVRIARLMGRSPSVVSREFVRHRGPGGRMSEALCMRFNPQSRRRVRNNDCCVPEET